MIKTPKTYQGYAGKDNKVKIYAVKEHVGTWYIVHGNSLVHFTLDAVEDGVDVIALSDADVFTWDKPITSENELRKAVEY